MSEMHIRPAFRVYAVFFGALLAIALALAWLAGVAFPDFGYPALALGGIAAAAIFLHILQCYYIHASTEYVAGGNEIIEVKGLWAKDENHVPVSKIEDYTVDRSVVGKFLGVASVGIQTARAERGYEIRLRTIPEKDAEAVGKFIDGQANAMAK